MYETWSKEWQGSKGCRQAKTIAERPNPATSNFLIRKSRDQLGTIIRFLTGHAHLKRHNSLINKNGDKLCRLCAEDEETPGHIIMDCPRLCHIREQIFKQRFLNQIDFDKDIIEFILHPIVKNLEKFEDNDDENVD